MQYRIRFACVSDPGNFRRTNQDNFVCDGKYMRPGSNDISFPLCGSVLSESTPLFGVFDGMGGEQYGETAAYIAAQCAASMQASEDGIRALNALCQSANQHICDFSAQNGYASIGTTAAMLLFGKKMYVCNIGDSKIFRLRDGHMEQLSQDHLSMAPFGVKPPLSQNLGIPREEMTIEPYCVKSACEDKDVYLICSDGLTDMVGTGDIQKVLQAVPIEAAAQQLLDMALRNGGKDNVTVILCKIEKLPFRLFPRK